jgi:hypothetical protein
MIHFGGVSENSEEFLSRWPDLGWDSKPHTYNMSHDPMTGNRLQL